ncbi:uncharacterized protein LOC114747393 [Neltuma alba]|uniref:uncharacterized protein LOC114747393 n=1 Tax=Neltuma alba TaxID=207710 RepID=UPI0010A4BA66|nr:uncharacterized protein LOC114747393 [Prosopis alba]
MMARIRVRFERVAAAFDADIARVRLCESSGSDHSPESSNTDLSDLVKSFMEKNEMEGKEEVLGVNDDGEEGEDLCDVDKDEWSGSGEKKEKLKSLFEGIEVDEDDRNVKENIRRQVEAVYGSVGDKSSPGFKRRLMTRLREKGFDAGVCKSKWDKNSRFPGGDYEYLDINMGGKRYIVEVNLAGEFEIARPTNYYCSLLRHFPVIFVGKLEELKKIVRLMCTAIKASMKSVDLFVPPWRRHGYVRAKWFSSYRRTTNEVSARKDDVIPGNEDVSPRRSIINGFEAKFVKAYNCRDDYGKTKPGFRVGLLATALNS